MISKACQSTTGGYGHGRCGGCDCPCHITRLMFARAVPEPRRGQPFTYNDRRWTNGEGTTIIPTYVKLSEWPDKRGGCLTADYASDRPLNYTGWYIEHAHGRTFVAFEDAR